MFKSKQNLNYFCLAKIQNTVFLLNIIIRFKSKPTAQPHFTNVKWIRFNFFFIYFCIANKIINLFLWLRNYPIMAKKKKKLLRLDHFCKIQKQTAQYQFTAPFN